MLRGPFRVQLACTVAAFLGYPMGWKRFLTGIGLGLIASLFMSCGNTALQSPPSPDSPEQAAETTPAPQAGDETLPPETQQIIASLGPEGLVSPPRGDVRLAVISDLNSAYGSTEYDPEVDKAIALLPFWQPDLVVCSGDMVAGQSPTLTPEQIKAMWAAFDQHVAAPLRQANLPYGFTLGNHDASGAKGIEGNFLFQQERELAAAYWNEPSHDPGIEFVDRNEFPFYYSFKKGDIFFLVWDGSSHKIPPDKLAWVESALSSPAAQGAKLRILLGHLPLYAVSVGRNEPGEVMENADALRAMLEKYDVHTYISGHHHAYYPGHRGELQLLHMGILGSGPRPLLDSDLPPWKALTIIDVNFKDPAITTYTTYDMQTLATIKYEQLPRFLMGHNGAVVRRDLTWDDLDTTEKNLCEQRLGKALCGPA